MISISISGLHDEIIRGFRDFRITDQCTVAVSDITGEDQFALILPFFCPHFNKGRSKQMACIPEAYRQFVANMHFFVIITWHKIVQNTLRIIYAVHRNHFRLSGSAGFPVSPFCLKLLNMRAVFQHNVAELRGGICGKNLSPKTSCIQKRQ